MIAGELTLRNRAVVALEALFRHQLEAIVGRLLAALAMLARTYPRFVDRPLDGFPHRLTLRRRSILYFEFSRLLTRRSFYGVRISL